MKASDTCLRQLMEQYNQYKHLQQSIEKERTLPSCSANYSAMCLFVPCILLQSNPVPHCLLTENSTFIKKVNLPWNQQVSYRNPARVQAVGPESRCSCHIEINQMSVSDGTAGICYCSLMSKHCGNYYESEICSVRCCHNTTAVSFHQHQNMKIEQRIMHKLQ